MNGIRVTFPKSSLNRKEDKARSKMYNRMRTTNSVR